ncbi:hypothetical protein CCAN12_810126 [Capnocytophaga canimorsus]|uniref:Uncharacterized protein n=1 Tax=Capnocytophaga canimorsus TaxID=28188 RepID=A0A0B7HVW3_9FLAO|nr:hypothetical protein CCAN12_810126 [Capnocytophaga canimorsus]
MVRLLYRGRAYRGNRIINHYDAPLWKLPVFVKAGAIIPITHPHNNVTQNRSEIAQIRNLSWSKKYFC